MKKCRDCGAELGSVELWLRRGLLYCATDYQQRFGTWPAGVMESEPKEETDG